MKQRRGIFFLGIISMMVLSTGVRSQTVAEKPKINVGDQWEFARTTKPSSKEDTWSRTVLEIPAEDRLRVKLESGTVADYNGVMDWMPQGRPEFLRTLANYPLTVGKTWSIDRRFENPNTSETGKAKMSAFEQITVPAGTYQCFRIEAESSLVNKNYSERRFWTRWYCPEVKWIAKEVVETRTFNPVNPAANGTVVETSELVRFTPGK